MTCVAFLPAFFPTPLDSPLLSSIKINRILDIERRKDVETVVE